MANRGPTVPGAKDSRRNLRTGPKAPKGNTRSVVHHGRTKRAVIPGTDEARAEIVEALAAAAPVRDTDGGLPAADAAIVELAARELARIRNVDDWLAQRGVLDRRGHVRPAAGYLEKATSTLDRLLTSLGMNPRSRAVLGLDLARQKDLASAMSEPDPVKRERLLREAGVVDMEGVDAPETRPRT